MNKFITKDEYTIMIINSPKHGIFEVLIDTEDVQKVQNIHWCIEFDRHNPYVRNRHKNLKLHRLITNCPSDLVVDHINRNTLDNRKKNLRVCTISENNRNRPPMINYPHSTDEYGIGVWKCKYKDKVYSYYKVQIYGYKSRVFKDMEKAIAYRNYLIELKVNAKMEVK